MSYIIIGREKASGKLLLSSVGKNGTYGEEGSVPASVCENHCRIDIEGRNIHIRNLDLNNYTYVNSRAVESKTITRKDKIELGGDRYLLPWQAIDAILPPETDITSLKKIWEDFDHQNIKLQIDERRFNTMRSATGLVTMIAIALSIMTGKQSAWYLLLYGLAIVASFLFLIKAYRDASKIPQKRNELNRQFQRDYTCPHCGHFLGNQSYEILAQNPGCPYCHAKFIH